MAEGIVTVAIRLKNEQAANSLQEAIELAMALKTDYPWIPEVQELLTNLQIAADGLEVANDGTSR